MTSHDQMTNLIAQEVLTWLYILAQDIMKLLGFAESQFAEPHACIRI